MTKYKTVIIALPGFLEFCKDGGCESTEDTLVIGDGSQDFTPGQLGSLKDKVAKDALIIISGHGKRVEHEGKTIHSIDISSTQRAPTSFMLRALANVIEKDSKATIVLSSCYGGLALKELGPRIMPKGVTLISNSDENTSEITRLSIRSFDMIRGLNAEQAKSMLLRQYPEGFSCRIDDKLSSSNPPETLLGVEATKSHIKSEFTRLGITHRGTITDQMAQQYNLGLISVSANLDLSEAFLDSIASSGMDVNALNVGGETPLAHATYAKNIPLILALVRAGADVITRKDGETMLTEVIKTLPDSDSEVLSALLTAPSAVNIKNLAQGVTPLHISVALNKPNMTRELLAAGAEPDIREIARGESALHMACYPQVDSRIATMLINSGKADLNAARKDGSTSLNIAVGTRNLQTVTLLLATKKVNFGTKTLELASGDKEIASLLERALKEKASAKAASARTTTKKLGKRSATTATPHASTATLKPSHTPISTLPTSGVQSATSGSDISRIAGRSTIAPDVCAGNMLAANMQLLQLLLGVCAKESPPPVTTEDVAFELSDSLPKTAPMPASVVHHALETQQLSNIIQQEKLARRATNSKARDISKSSKPRKMPAKGGR